MDKNKRKYPVNHLVGFILSIVLTIVAAWTALSSGLPVVWIVISVMALAIIQALIQLFMFMHIIERGTTHTPWHMMFHAFVIVAIIVAGSIFTMSFGFTHDHGGGDHDSEEEIIETEGAEHDGH
ncbi:cytochrome C oxidase subunit IV family protein [Salinicoccus sp. ID82-1]|uniref:cytochrome C oxidase subunit IV family protein n=1 Tax=Salinicoccus sp. ID82-1 TaxID=2820269 RepID=UPI001F00C36B|nr:cytochrome C oxidase subunit IV family protein [Salinicoccus sp. ID82-1]MCG1010709.1 cytochrome C oxidase subunit IV family protein [Salinicoccus sp. ID82-1]